MTDQASSSLPRPADPRKQPRVLRRVLRLLIFTLIMLPIVTWLIAPVTMVYLLMHPRREAVPAAGTVPFPVEEVAWRTPDGLTMRGWFGRVSATAPIIVLGHGHPGNRATMLPQADFLHRAGYSVLMIDWRGWGASDGTMITLGLREPADLSAALDYLTARPDLDQPRFGGLGISMGAGLMLASAAHDHRLVAIVCDSIYTYQAISSKVDRWSSDGMLIGPLQVPVAPFALPTANLLLEGHMADLAPERLAAAVSPSALLLIHATHDSMPFTPVEGARTVFAAAHEPKALWVSPVGDHTTVIWADPSGYQQHVLDFFNTYLPLAP